MAAIKGKCLVTFTRVSNRTSTPCPTRSRQNEKLELKVFHVSRYVTRYQIPRFHAPNNGTMYRFTSQTLLCRIAASIFIGSSIGKRHRPLSPLRVSVPRLFLRAPNLRLFPPDSSSVIPNTMVHAVTHALYHHSSAV